MNKEIINTANDLDECPINMLEILYEEGEGSDADENDLRFQAAVRLSKVRTYIPETWQVFFRDIIEYLKITCDMCNGDKEIEFGSPEHLRTYEKVRQTLEFMGKHCMIPEEIVDEVFDPFILFPRVSYIVRMIRRRSWEMDYPLFHQFDKFYDKMYSINDIPDDVDDKINKVLETVKPWFNHINRYGYLDRKNGEIIINQNNRQMLQHYRSISSDDVWNYGGGVCWDTTRFLCERLGKLFPDMNPTCYIIYVYDTLEKHVGMNHAYFVLEVAKDYFMHIEFSYRGYCGIFLSRSPYVYALSFAKPIGGHKENDMKNLTVRKYKIPENEGIDLAMDDYTEMIISDKYSEVIQFPYSEDIYYKMGYGNMMKIIHQEK